MYKVESRFVGSGWDGTQFSDWHVFGEYHDEGTALYVASSVAYECTEYVRVKDPAGDVIFNNK